MIHQDRHHQRVCCLECVVDLAAGLFAIHCQVQFGVGKGDPGYPPIPPGRTSYLLGLLNQGDKRGGVTCRGMYGGGLKSDQPPGPLRSLSCEIHDSGPGGG